VLNKDLEATTFMKRPVPEATTGKETTQWNPKDTEPASPAAVQPPVANVEYSEQEGQAALAWICCDPFDPVPVGPKPKVVFGRSRWCDMILPHDSVSRNHAVIRVVGRDMILEDRSTYGTWVNDDRITQRKLKVGDTVMLGPYELHVRATKHADLPAGEDPNNTTKPLRTMGSSEAMSGRLERVPLTEVLQGIEFNKKSGTLRVFSDGFDATLVVYEGRPMYATSVGGAKDSEAVFGMLAQDRGNFSFMAKVEPGEMSMETTITGILLEASRRIDEG
jgi:pSer/pThr/pTyr-binding forkhead associated (FHA) protein